MYLCMYELYQKPSTNPALLRVEKYVSRQWHSHADLVTQGILLRASDGDGHAVSSLKSRHHHPSGEHPSFPKIDS